MTVSTKRARYVAVASNTTAVFSHDGITWMAAIMPVSTPWRNVTYGDGKFVAVASSNSNTTAYSADGNTWTEGPDLPSSAYWVGLAVRTLACQHFPKRVPGAKF
jgi:hypothetical protein